MRITRARVRFTHLAALAGLLAAAGTGVTASQTAPAPPLYDVRVELDQPSLGTTTFLVDKAGKVSGTLHIETPNVVDATLAGTVKDGTWTFEYPFSMPAQGCTGTVAGTAKVSADNSSVIGTLTVGGGCVDQPLSAPFSFKRRAK